MTRRFGFIDKELRDAVFFGDMLKIKKEKRTFFLFNRLVLRRFLRNFS